MYCSLPDSCTLAEHPRTSGLAEHPRTSGYVRCTTVLMVVDFSFESHLYMIKSHSRTVPTAAFLSNILVARPLESQLKLEVEFHRVPYNQTFDFVTVQFVKMFSLDIL